MITAIESLSVYELAGSHCAMNNKYLLYFENKKWGLFDDAKKQACLDFYADYVPEDIILIMQDERDCCIEYTSEEVAILNASEWFPPKAYCSDPDFYFRVLVFDPNANIVFENLDPREENT